jgi:cell fate (sporulation/competence/biofilm development) regulator YmcA (YheA/YmcA/DUF963 family)
MKKILEKFRKKNLEKKLKKFGKKNEKHQTNSYTNEVTSVIKTFPIVAVFEDFNIESFCTT